MPAVVEKTKYVNEQIADFENYLKLELEILDCKGVVYSIVYDYIRELKVRLLRFIMQNCPEVPSPKQNYAFNEWMKGRIEEVKEERKIYFQRIAEILEEKSFHYPASSGSVPEDIGKTLKKISVKTKYIH